MTSATKGKRPPQQTVLGACLGGAVAVYRTQPIVSLAVLMQSAPLDDDASKNDIGYPISEHAWGVPMADTIPQKRIGYPTSF